MTPIFMRFIALICLPVIALGLIIGNVTTSNLSTRKIASNSHVNSAPKDEGLLGKLTKNILQLVPSIAPSQVPNDVKNTSTSPSSTTSNTSNSNDSTNTNTSETQVAATPTLISTTNPSHTTQVPTTQAQTQPSKVPSLTPTVAPQATPTPIFTQLVVLGCYEFGLNYCRQGLPSNGSVYGGRLRVKNASTGELLASATLNGGGGATVTGLPIDKELEVVLLPPTDNPNYCGDREYVKFLSYKTYIRVELDLYRDVTPCISN